MKITSIYLLIVLFAALGFVSCDDEEESNPVIDPVDTTEVDFSLTAPGVKYLLDGNPVSHDAALVQAHNPVQDYLIITLPTEIDMQLRMLPNALGDYMIGEGPSEFRRVDAWYYGQSGNWYYANDSTGSGSISLIEIGTLGTPQEGYTGHIKGKFNLTVADANGNTHQITDGEFWTNEF